MASQFTRWILLLFVVLQSSCRVSHAADGANIIARCKQATALVDLRGFGSGTAFCVDAKGVFITNHHVVESIGLGGFVNLVLNPSEKREQIVKARVVGWSEENDLAVLLAQDVKGLVALPIASTQNVAEVDSITAYGFPFGTRLSGKAGGYPAISINTGKVTALRKRDGELQSIQIDAAVNPGNSGGPLVNEAGEVVGVITSGNQVARIAIAMPIDFVTELLRHPAILISQPELTYSKRTDSIPFVVEVLELSKDTTADMVELEISNDRDPPRKFTEKVIKGFATINASPVDPQVAKLKLRLTPRTGDLSRQADVDDRPVKVGRHELRLAEIRKIDLRDKYQIVTCTSGRKLAGEVTGLQNLEWNDGRPIDFDSEVCVDFHAIDRGPVVLHFDFSAQRSGKVVSEFRQRVELANPPQPIPEHPHDPGDPFSPILDEILIEARLEGTGELVVTPEGLMWRHKRGEKPGVTVGGVTSVVVNDHRWNLKWQNTVQVDQREDDTEIYPLRLGYEFWNFELISVKADENAPHDPARGKVTTRQDEADFIVEFDDVAPGTSLYQFRLKKKYYRNPPHLSAHPPSRLPTRPSIDLPAPTAMNAEPAGPAIDLISLVDFTRDKIIGDCTMEGASLICGPLSKLYLPSRVPDDYQLTLRFKRIAGAGSVSIGFVMAGQQSALACDAYGSHLSGIYVDGRDPDANCTTRRRPLLQNDRVSTIVMTVHPDHLHVVVDGKTLVDWHGDSKRLFLNPAHGLPNRESPSICTAEDATFQFDSAMLIPIKPEPRPSRVTRLAQNTELLPLFDMVRDINRGKWEISKTVVFSPEDRGCIYLPTEVPEEYTVSATVELPLQAHGDTEVAFGLVSGTSCFQVAARSGSAGLDMIDGKRWIDNESRIDAPILKPGIPVRFDCTVTKAGVRAEVDGKTLIDWRGDFRRLSIPADWAPGNGRKLFLGSNHPLKFRSIQLGPPRPAPNLPPHAPFAVGKVVDLLALIETPRDALSGTWNKTGSQLRVMGETPFSKLLIPSEVPQNYKLTFTIARESGGASNNEALVLNLPMQSSVAEILLDAEGSSKSGIHLDGLLAEFPRTVASPMIPQEGTLEFVAFVYEGRLKLLRGNEVLIDWTGNPQRFWQQTRWGTPNARIVFGSYQQRFRFDKIELQMLEPLPLAAATKPVNDGNLLSLIETKRDSRIGEWNLGDQGLVCPRIPMARLRLPGVVPDRYLLSVDVERLVPGGQEIYLGMIVGGQPCSVAIDGNQCSRAGLQFLDGRAFHDSANLTRRAYASPILPTGRTVTIQCFVLPDTVIVNCGDREVIRWHGDARRLTPGTDDLPSNSSAVDRERLWLGARDSEFVIRKLHLRPLKDNEVTKIAEGFTGVVPIAVKSDLEAEIGVPFNQVTSDKPEQGETYLLVNTATGRCLSVIHGAVVSGPFVHSAGPVERWKLLPSDDKLKLMNEQSNKVLAVPQGSKNPSTQLVEYQDLNSGDQKFEFISAGKHYHLRSCWSELLVAVAGAVQEQNARVIQWPQNEATDQIWRLQKVPRPIKSN